MKCKYVLPTAMLIKRLVNEEYHNIYWEKIGRNKYVVKSDEGILAVYVSRKYIRFIEELIWKLSFIPKEEIR